MDELKEIFPVNPKFHNKFFESGATKEDWIEQMSQVKEFTIVKSKGLIRIKVVLIQLDVI